MEIKQELTKNDIKEGLVRVSGENISFFHGGKFRTKGHKLHITLPDGRSCETVITFSSKTGGPRFLKDIRGALRAYFQKVYAKPGDILKINCDEDSRFAIKYSSHQL